MSEIKFRAWDKKNKKMIGPFYVGSELSMAWPPEMQYAGLKDKDGKEIFAGDIVRINLGLPAIVMFGLYRYTNGINYFTEGNGFFLERKEPDFDEEGNRQGDYLWQTPLANLVDSSKYEILGNIYENAELLEAK